jgi:oligopeptide/dipeptide ABC transporter ATP-binding protein
VEVDRLVKEFPIKRGIIFQRQIGAVHAVQDVSFTIAHGETLGLVGESGCGKSTTARLIARLLEPTAGTIAFDGVDITRLSSSQMRPLRREVQMVFQDPYASLNPRHSVGQIIAAPFKIHRIEGDRTPRPRVPWPRRGNHRTMVRELMARVGLNPEHYNRYPHEFSGGQRQRIGVARALALRPKLIICDEPVSALDVSIQAQIVNLLQDLQSDFGLTYLFISHDLGVIRHVSDRVAVMYLGRIVELSASDALYANPRHPYTAALLSAVPKGHEHSGDGERILLQGDVPSPVDPPPGCPFHPRCPKARLISGSDGTVPEQCRTEVPELQPVGNGQEVACWFPLQPGEKLQQAAHS